MKNDIKDLENKYQILHTALGILAKEVGKEPSEYVRLAMVKHCCHDCAKFLESDKEKFIIQGCETKNQYCKDCYSRIMQN